MELTNGVGVDTTIVAAGRDEALITAVKVTRPGGVISDISSYRQVGPEYLQLPTREWGWGLADKKLVSTLCPPGGERIGRLLRLIENGRVDLSPMVTHRYSGFDEIPKAFADALGGDEQFVKAVVTLAR